MYAELTAAPQHRARRGGERGALRLLRAVLDAFVHEAARTAPALAGLPAARTLPLLHGRGVSGGRATGHARLVRDDGDIETFVEGDVLVAEYGSVAVRACLPLASAVVLTYGGALSSAAICARELGIPAVLGVTEATEAIVPGAWLRVDGDAGTVAITTGGW